MIVIIVGLIVLDQGTKWGMRQYYPALVQYTRHEWLGIELPVTSLIVGTLLLFGWWSWVVVVDRTVRWQSWPLGLILGGGLSNAFDRLDWGQVVDFTVLPWWQFNGADMAILLGLGWVGYAFACRKDGVLFHRSAHDADEIKPNHP